MKKPININSFQIKAPLDSNYLPLTRDSIEEVEDAVKNDPVYGDKANGGVLRKYFSLEKENTDKTIILHKIMLIDYTYSTNLSMYKNSITLSELADIIMDIECFDKKIKNGCVEVVDTVLDKVWKKTEGKYTPFSFVSKYCAVNNCDGYKEGKLSIYDNIVAKAIPHYLDIKAKRISNIIKGEDGRPRYSRFHSLISRMIEVYKLQDIPQIHRKLDHFLWYPNRPIKENDEMFREWRINMLAKYSRKVQ